MNNSDHPLEGIVIQADHKQKLFYVLEEACNFVEAIRPKAFMLQACTDRSGVDCYLLQWKTND